MDDHNESTKTSSPLVERIVSALTPPFDLRYVKWYVSEVSDDRTLGFVFPYADPRAYAARLNEVLGQDGWTVEYKTDTMPNITRYVCGRAISSGKIITTATLTIHAIGAKSSQGENWADERNAVTSAEAQAMKRAAAMFGLGKYFYDLKADPNIDFWVPLDRRGKPLYTPQLPDWALLPHDRANRRPPEQRRFLFRVHESETVQRQRSASAQDEARKKAHIKALGLPLYQSIVAEAERRLAANNLKRDPGEFLESKLAYYGKLRQQVSNAAADLPAGELENLLDRHRITTLDKIPDYGTLHSLADYFGVLKKAA